VDPRRLKDPLPPPLARSRRVPAGGRTASGSQVLLATHSPVHASFPGATVYELDGSGFAARDWADLDLVRDWEAFFADPARLHHHLLDD